MSLFAAIGLALQVTGGTPAIIDRARIDPRADVSFHALALPETVYVGAPALYELGVFITEEVRSRLRQNPQFVPPDLRSVLSYDLGQRSHTVVRDGRTYEVHVFRRALFPVAAGRIVVPPARLSYNMPLGSSFFSREEQRLLRSEPVSFVAIAPPTTGRPASWGGAVGDLRIRALIGPGTPRVGDPFVVTLRVSGDANVHLLPRPNFALQWATVVAGPERVVVDSNATRVRGSKEFDWLVTPIVDGSLEIPVVDYPYFDPDARRYRVASSEATLVRVGEGALANVDSTPVTAAGRGALPIRPLWRRPWPDAPDTTMWFWAVLMVVPLPGIARLWRERPRRAARNAPTAELRALVSASVGDAARVRAAVRSALTARLGAYALPWGDTVALRRALRHHGVTDATIDEALVLFARVDGAAYGEQPETVADAARRALDVCEAIDREARRPPPSKRASGARTVTVALLLIASSLAAQQALDARGLFARGVTEYATNDPVAAARSFFASAEASPLAAVAWANAGTASWAAADTARAVVGWQRALRLNPTDADARVRLTLVGTDAGAGRDVVWPVPRRLPAWAALLLWIGAWVAIWRAYHRRYAAAGVVVAMALVVLSQVHARRLDDPALAVISRPAPLRLLPAMGAEAGPTPLTGELVRVAERSGVWVRVIAAGARDGWIDGARLLDLSGRPLRE
ncbi:MAG TPA: hypothetical protein VJR92_14295 [Gemmatimonadaceae bacterium]|nr:hypothetical protein [Gemmatimonadaceae bacterium]